MKMNTPDPQQRQQLESMGKKYTEAANSNDAAAIAAIYTEDAVFVSDTGTLHGREAIEKWYADLLEQSQIKDYTTKYDQDSPYIRGAAGNERWVTGEWSFTAAMKEGDPLPLKGYFSSIDIRENDDWKIRILTYNITPTPAK